MIHTSIFQKVSLSFLLCSLFVLYPNYVQAQWGGPVDEVEIIAVLDKTHVRPGDAFRVAVHFEIVPKWHIGSNPIGPGIGMPTTVSVDADDQFSPGALRILPPEKYDMSDIEPGAFTWVYHSETTMYVPVQVNEHAVNGEYTVQVKVAGQVCEVGCIPFDQSFTLSIRVADTFSVNDDTKHYFLLYDSSTSSEDNKEGEDAGQSESNLQIVDTSIHDPEQITKYSVKSVDTTASSENQSSSEITSISTALFFGFIAGLILNVMPCVLPVISLKVLSFAQQAGDEPKRVLKLACCFSLGIIFVFLVLATLASLASYQWGEQFQSDTFNIIMVSFVFFFSLSLFGVYEIIVPSVAVKAHEHKETYSESFFKGMLATFLATPCSGPFLGSTLAWVLSQSTIVIYAVFSSIGIGMACPYVILAANKKFMRFIPKPGAWMETFKQFTGFILLAVVVYLLALLDPAVQLWTVVYCLILAIAAWVIGQISFSTSLLKRWMYRLIAVAIATGGAYVCFVYEAKHSSWEPLTQKTLQAYHEKRYTVVIDWTADW